MFFYVILFSSLAGQVLTYFSQINIYMRKKNTKVARVYIYYGLVNANRKSPHLAIVTFNV